MFKLFSKKSKDKNFIVPEMKVQVLILSLMNSYLEQCKGDMVLVKEEPDLEKEFKRLVSLGLSNTENAKLLKSKLDEIQSRKDKSKFGKDVIEWIQDMKKVFPDSYLISFDQFYQILKDYRLVTGFLKNYTGIIPSSNITEIEKVMEYLKSKKENVLFLNFFDLPNSGGSYYNYFYFVRGITYRSENEKKDCIILKEIFERYGNLIRKGTNSGWKEETFRLDCIELGGINFNDVVKGSLDDYKINVEIIDKTELMIAAPRNCFSTEFKVSQMPVDPIVFQCCPYGVIVHSVWGEEADDKVLGEYKMLNQKILSM